MILKVNFVYFFKLFKVWKLIHRPKQPLLNSVFQNAGVYISSAFFSKKGSTLMRRPEIVRGCNSLFHTVLFKYQELQSSMWVGLVSTREATVRAVTCYISGLGKVTLYQDLLSWWRFLNAKMIEKLTKRLPVGKSNIFLRCHMIWWTLYKFFFNTQLVQMWYVAVC